MVFFVFVGPKQTLAATYYGGGTARDFYNNCRKNVEDCQIYFNGFHDGVGSQEYGGPNVSWWQCTSRTTCRVYFHGLFAGERGARIRTSCGDGNYVRCAPKFPRTVDGASMMSTFLVWALLRKKYLTQMSSQRAILDSLEERYLHPRRVR